MKLGCLLGWHNDVKTLEVRPEKYYNVHVMKFCLDCHRFQEIYGRSRDKDESPKFSEAPN